MNNIKTINTRATLTTALTTTLAALSVALTTPTYATPVN